MDNGEIGGKVGGSLSSSDSDISYRAGAYVFAGVAAGLMLGFLLSQPIFFWKSNTVGNVAEILNVVVAALVGWGVFLLGIRAHAIELQIARSSEKQSETERQLTLIALSAGVITARTSLREIDRLLGDPGYENCMTGNNEEFVPTLRKLIKDASIPSVDRHRERLVLVGNPHAGRLVRVHETMTALSEFPQVASRENAQKLGAAIRLASRAIAPDLDHLVVECKKAVLAAKM